MRYSYKDGMAKTQGRTHACHVALFSVKPAAVRHLCSLLHDRKSLRPSLHKPAIHAPLNHEISLIILIFLFSLVNDIERFCNLLRIEIAKYNGRVKCSLEIPIYRY